jgi:hypothetical protein
MWIVPSSLFNPMPVLHREHELGEEIARVLADDRRRRGCDRARDGEHLHETVRLAVRDRAIEVVDAVRP